MSHALILTVQRGKNLAAMDKGGTSDPYVVIKADWTKQQYKTKVIKKTLTPEWNTTFTYYIKKCEGVLTFKLWDRDRWSSDDYLGKVEVDISTLANGEVVEKPFKLVDEPPAKKTHNKPKRTGCGELYLKLHFPVESKEKKSSKKSSKKVAVHDVFQFGKVLGKGGFSVVKLGTDKEGNKWAIKIIDKVAGKEELNLMQREIEIMRKLKHKNIVSLHEVYDEDEHLYLVLEYVTGGELFDQIVSRGHYSEKDAASIIKQILEAVDYMHANGVAHRDLKPENLLCSGKDHMTIKITDFGLSKSFGEATLQTACGTPDYVAPEVLLGKPYDSSVDIWSIGVITYILLCGFPPFYGQDNQQIFEKIMSAKFDFPSPDWDDISDGAKQFIKDMLTLEPKERPTPSECLQSSWIRGNAPERQLSRLSSFKDQMQEYTSKRKK